MVVTVDGLIHTGMPILPTRDRVLILLSDPTRLDIAGDELDERSRRSEISVMPENLLKDLTLQDIADLSAYLETRRSSAFSRQWRDDRASDRRAR